ncbi:TlpA family protein disulfide reductase [Jiangella rhizosphaerae]|uniref:TlpA family protein disulfide reductase n=1 Tax=Jiangella rhizosphaerae TaxID=2293569 RepID=A0A418KX80_9ACTN|nr:TlpA disulfide reductase family protein [Jiangella rhizosphaerae]RIQ35664.1 TlpA family protein disulfide reductase [Jiangella rhizosphaerae]
MRRILLLAAAAALALAGCSDGRVERSDNANQAGYIAGDGTISIYEPAERKAAPEFSGELLDGGEFQLADRLGDVVVLNVWGSWCPPCRREAPDLQAAYEALEPEGVQFVGVNVREPNGQRPAQQFEDEFGITYPSIYDPEAASLLAFRDTVPPAAIPSTLVIDREGRIAARVLGPLGETTLTDIVREIAAEAPVTGAAAEGTADTATSGGRTIHGTETILSTARHRTADSRRPPAPSHQAVVDGPPG